MARHGADLDGLPGGVGASGFRAARKTVSVLTRLRVATWNVQEGLPEGGGNDLRRREEQASVADPINKNHIDIIALQEVDFDQQGHSFVLTKIAQETDLQHAAKYVCSPSSFFPGARAGVAIASRYPIISRWCFDLPNPGLKIAHGGNTYKSYDKGVLVCTIDTGKTALTLVCLHMFPFHMFKRSPEHAEFTGIWRALTERLGRRLGDRPVIVAGDFNTANRGLLPGINGRRLEGTTRDRETHRGFAADDILLSPELPAPAVSKVLDTFSDHRLCLVELPME